MSAGKLSLYLVSSLVLRPLRFGTFSARINTKATFPLVDDHSGLTTDSANHTRDPVGLDTGQRERTPAPFSIRRLLQEVGELRGDRKQAVLATFFTLARDPQHR